MGSKSVRKKIKIKERFFEYSLKRRSGSRCVRLAVYPDGNFVVTAPRWYPVYVIDRFLEEKSGWIFDKLKNVDFVGLLQRKKEESEKYTTNKVSTLHFIQSRVEFLNRHYGFSFNKITVKNQKTCWGSASQKGNLNFNHKIINLSKELQDYIIVHELCHLKELNHGRKFWALVGETFPEYKELRKKLRRNRI